MKKIIAIILGILILLGVFGCYYFHKRSNIPNTPKNIETIDINDEKIKQLYNYLQDNQLYTIVDNDYKTVYQDKLVTYNDLTKYSKLRNVFYKLEKENATIDMYNKEILSSFILLTFNTDDIEAIKFADNCLPNNSSCIIPMSFYYQEISGYYQVACDNDDYDDMCIWNFNGNYLNKDNILYKLVKAEKSNNEYYLYDNVFYSDGKNLYDSYSKNKIIYTSPDDNLIDYEFVSKKYNNYLFQYKHTYKQNESGEYYWYSTEPIKKGI